MSDKDKLRIVAAANQWTDDQGEKFVVMSVRHSDAIAADVLIRIFGRERLLRRQDSIEGFVDSYGEFHDRAAAWVIAKAADQIRMVKSWNLVDGRYILYSENLY